MNVDIYILCLLICLIVTFQLLVYFTNIQYKSQDFELLFSIHTIMQITTREKQNQRNITPNFVIIKSNSRPKVGKNSYKSTIKDDNAQATKTDRSTSKNSKCSFEAYERRVLHLSKLKNNLVAKNKTAQHEPIKVIPNNNTFNQNNGIDDSKRTSSNPARKDRLGRQNNIYIGIGKKQADKDHSLSRKKSSGSGKIIFRPHSRSNSNRDEDSLQKQQQRAKIMNIDLMTDLIKHPQTPNYIHKLKLKRNQKQIKQKKRERETPRSHLLNLDINIKGSEALTEYQIYGQLGKGAYGVVRMGIDRKSGQKVAIKFYPKKHLNQMNRLKNLQRQINILSQLDHPIIAKLIDAIQTSTDIYLVLQYGGANSLYNYLLSKQEHRLKQYQAKKFLHVIAQTVAYLHNKNIVHRDIKAQNILINRYKQLKLIDFGFSIRSVPPNTIDTFCGTPTYMAPEIVSKIDHIPIYTDMWSLGILFYVMLQGNYPFRSRNQQQLFQKIKKGKFQYIHNDISQQSKMLIQSLLQVNPYHRLTIQDVLSSKWSSFFQDSHLEETTQ